MSKRLIAFVLTLALVFSCVPAVAFATDAATATLNVADVYATPGGTVTVGVEIENNPGILGATLTVSWDEGLTLTDSASGEAFSELTFQAPSRYTNGCNFVWYGSSISQAVDGPVLLLTFTVPEDATDAQSYDVAVTYDSRDVLDQSYNTVELTVNNGSVRIVTYTPGDVTGDERINPLDLIKLSQYISDGGKADPEGYNAVINESAADVNDDGRINPLDLIWISQYISDGCKTDPEGYNRTLYPSTPECVHQMQAFAEKAATCTETGNKAYWYCTECEKYFSNEAGTVEIDPEDMVIEAAHSLTAVEAKSPSYTEAGNIAYWYCSACEKYFTDAEASEEITYEQTIIPKLQATEHLIEYDIANGDPYLEKLVENGTIQNPNPACYAEGTGLTLTNLTVAGYRFLGWYDLAENGTLVKKIDATATEDYQLYAYWSKIEYTVQYKSSLFTDRAQDTYTVDTGLVLPTPKLSNYVFTGWADENGELYSETMIPVGTTGHMVLEANWTSERNKTWTKTKLDAPIKYTEDNTLFFVYEIGEIQNVPLYTIKDFGYIAEGGVEKSEETTFSTVISEGTAEQIAESVAKATTQSSNWSLSNGWSEGTDISQEWLTENGYEYDEVIGRATNEESNWNVSTGTSGSTDTSTGTSNEKGWTNEAKITSSSSTTNEASINAGLESSVGVDAYGVKAEVKASLSAEESVSQTNSSGFETGGSKSGTAMDTTTTSTSSGWSNSSSYGGSKSSSESFTASTGISEKVTEQYGYGKNYTSEYTSGESQGLEYSNDEAKEWSSSVTYNTETAESVTRSWTTEQTKAGYHRWIMAGTAHVFAVVAYDMEAQSYYVYTYTVMDDEMHEFEDYSYTTASYNDHENGVISFEIPYEVAEYVAEQTVYSQGLKVDQETGIITGYTGTDNCVVIPEYMNIGGGDVVQITGLAEGAFQNNTGISAVVLSDYITAIPNNCFDGCTNLEGIVGGTITTIGDRAFAGTAIVDSVVRSNITHVGDAAFVGVDRVYFNCANAQVLQAADNCGANKIYVDLAYLSDIADANGIELTIPEGTEYFEIDGNGETVYDMTISSGANETVFTKINLVNTAAIPVKTSAEKVVFNQSSVSATGIALVLSAEQTELYLQSTVNITSANENAVLCKSVALYEWNESVNGHLAVGSKLLYVGGVENTDLISEGTCEQITAEAFGNMSDSCVLYFNANGGTMEQEAMIVCKDQPYGEMPVPEREYYAFAGWYTAAEGGEEVTAETVVTTVVNHTLYAHWTPITAKITFDANGGSVSTVSKIVYTGNAVGDLPVPTRDYYTFAGWSTSDGTAINAATVITEAQEFTVYAQWTLNPLSDWVEATDVPSDAQVVNTKWTYDLTTNITSSQSSVAGYTLYKTTSAWSDYGAWSSWSKTAATSSDSRQVETKTVTDQAAYTNYKYYVYRTSDGYGYGTYGYNTGSHGTCTKYDEINLSYALPVYDSSLGTYGPYNSSMFSHSYDSYWFFGGSSNVAAVTHTEYRYRDRSLIYTYYHTKTEAKESTTEVTASDTISNVVKMVQYRAK